MPKYKVRVRIKSDTDAGVVLYTEGMTKDEAFAMCPLISASVQVAAIDVINPRGYVVEAGAPTRTARS